MRLEENKTVKIFKSEEYNYFFDKQSGFFARWGKTEDEDPLFSPMGPEIADIEITTKCNGIPNKNGIASPCRFCYKSNTANGINMSFETFKTILDKMPRVDDRIFLTQIAFGADAEAKSNPDLWKMMEYSRQNGVIPNITVANIDDETADNLAKYAGAVAVSRYANKDICYNSIKKLIDAVLRKKIIIRTKKKM